MGLEGKTPSEVAGIKIEGDNKWITLIQNATAKKQLLWSNWLESLSYMVEMKENEQVEELKNILKAITSGYF